MAVITRLSADTIAQTLSEYPVGTLDGLKEASEGSENTNYFVRTSQADGKTGEYVLTLIESEDDSGSHVDTVVKILDICIDAGLPVPQVIRTVKGASETTLLGKPTLLCSKLDGLHVVNPVRSQCAAIGRFLARFHAATAPIQSEVASYVRDSEWLTSRTEAVKSDISLMDRADLEATVQTVVDLLMRPDVETLPRSVIHADLFLDNALFNTHGLAGILDFHQAGTGYCVYDLAVAINDWCRNGDSLDFDRVIELLRGYSSIRAITQAELWFLPTFLLYAALAFWLSRLLIYIRTDLPAHYPVKNPDDFKDLVKRHTRSPFSVVRENLL